MAWHGMAGAMSLTRGHCSRGWKRRQVVSRRKGDHTGSTSVAQEGTSLPVPHLPLTHIYPSPVTARTSLSREHACAQISPSDLFLLLSTPIGSVFPPH